MNDHFLQLQKRILQLKTGQNCIEHWWLGTVEKNHPMQIPVHIAQQVGFSPVPEDFYLVKRRKAAEILAWVIGESLCFGAKNGKAELVEELVCRFQALGPDMRYWSNGGPPTPRLSEDGKIKGWVWGCRPVANGDLTIDAGLIGSDGSTGFIYWAEDMD